MSRNGGYVAAAASRERSASAAPGSASTRTLGTRSAKTCTPWAAPGTEPGPLDQRAQTGQGEVAGDGGGRPSRPGPCPGWPTSRSSSARASANRPATARCRIAAATLAASTLTVPPGRSTRATAASASAGESTYSRTLWQITRSADASPTTLSRPRGLTLDRADPHVHLGRTALRGRQRVRARVHHRDRMAQHGQRHGEATGPAARVDDVQPVPAGVRGPGREDAAQHVPHDGRARPQGLAAQRPASSRHGFNVVPHGDK